MAELASEVRVVVARLRNLFIDMARQGAFANPLDELPHDTLEPRQLQALWWLRAEGLLTVNALAAADGVLIPLECEYFSMRGAALLMDTIQKVQERLNPKLEITGILATMFDPRTLHSREVMGRVVERFGDIVFDTVINRTVRFPETTVAGEPITRWAPRSAGAKAYRALAREVIAR